MINYSRETLAYHEAGHAVVGVAIGRTLKTVSILPDPVYGKPGCHFEAPGDTLEEHYMVAVTAAAGALAEERGMGIADPAGSKSDRAEFAEACHRATGSLHNEPFIQHARHKAKVLVENHWVAIAEIVKRLLTVNTMCEFEVRTVVEADGKPCISP